MNRFPPTTPLRSPRPRRLRSGSEPVIWSAIAIAVVAIVFGLISFTYLTSRREVEAEITGKDRVCDTTDTGKTQTIDCKYLIFTDQGTFEITDSLIVGRFDSSDIYGKFREDRSYRFEVIGWRQGFLSQYPNVASDPVEIEGRR